MVTLEDVKTELSRVLKTVNWEVVSEADIRTQLREKLGSEVESLPDFKKVVKVRHRSEHAAHCG